MNGRFFTKNVQSLFLPEFEKEPSQWSPETLCLCLALEDKFSVSSLLKYHATLHELLRVSPVRFISSSISANTLPSGRREVFCKRITYKNSLRSSRRPFTPILECTACGTFLLRGWGRKPLRNLPPRRRKANNNQASLLFFWSNFGRKLWIVSTLFGGWILN